MVRLAWQAKELRRGELGAAGMWRPVRPSDDGRLKASYQESGVEQHAEFPCVQLVMSHACHTRHRYTA